MRPTVLLLALLCSGLLLGGCELIGLGGSPSGPRLKDIPGKIVYSKEVTADGNLLSQIFVTDQTGTRQLTRDDNPDREIFATDPAWGPDGETIIYATNRGDVPVSKTALYRMDADGSNQRPLMQAPGLERPLWGSNPAVSPDGRKVAYDKCTNCELGGKNTEVFVADLEAGTVDTLTSFLGKDALPTWSPDGIQVAFQSNRDYFQADSARFRTDLYSVSLGEMRLRRLTDTGGSGPVWHPDRIKVAYLGLDGGSKLLDLPTGNVSPIKTDLPDLWSTTPVDWSRDGEDLLLFALM